MNRILQSLWMPKIITNYYAGELARAPMFYLYTLLLIGSAGRIFLLSRGKWNVSAGIALTMLAALWIHLVLQHTRIRRLTQQADRTNLALLATVSWSTGALVLVAVITIGS